MAGELCRIVVAVAQPKLSKSDKQARTVSSMAAFVESCKIQLVPRASAVVAEVSST